MDDQPASLKHMAFTAAEKGKQQNLQDLEHGIVHQSIYKLLDYPTSSNHEEIGTLPDAPRSHTIVRVLKKKDRHQFQMLEKFHKLLAENRFPDLGIMKNTFGNKRSFLVIRPSPALLHIYYNVAPIYIVVQALSQSNQSSAASVMRAVVKCMERSGIDVGSEDENTTWHEKMPMLFQNSIAAPTIGEVEKHRIHQLLKRREDECKKTVEKMAATEVDCGQEIEKVKDDCRRETKKMEDDCSEKLKNKEHECRRKVKSKEVESNKNLEKTNENCNQKIKKVKNDMQTFHKEMMKNMEEMMKNMEGMKELVNNQKLPKLTKKIVELTNQIKTIEREFKKKKKDLKRNFQAHVLHLRNTVTDLGKKNDHLTGENTRLQMKLDRAILHLNRETSTLPQTSTGTPVEPIGCNQENQLQLPVHQSTQERDGENHVRLSNPPAETARVERMIYNQFWLLIFVLLRRLGAVTGRQFRRWARCMLNDRIPADMEDVFVELDDRRVISVQNLQALRRFFEENGRVDLAWLVQQFEQGNYGALYNAVDVRRVLGRPANPNNPVLARVFGSPGSLN